MKPLPKNNPLDCVLERISRPTPPQFWLLKSGPIARKLNEDSKLDGGGK